MKRNIIKAMKRIWLMIAAVLINIVALAQSAGVNSDIDRGTAAPWYATPWAWIIGGAIVILLLAAIVTGDRQTSD